MVLIGDAIVVGHDQHGVIGRYKFWFMFEFYVVQPFFGIFFFLESV